jgi:tetratricopeptide (TPR) repeat protein
MSMRQQWRTLCVVLLLAGGCAAHPTFEATPSGPREKAGQAASAQPEPEPARCISKQVRDQIRCVGVERRVRLPVAHEPVPAPTKPRARRRKAALAPKHSLLPPLPVTSSAARQRRAAISDLERKCAHPKGKPPNRGCTDEVLYALSFEHQQRGDTATALALSREIIARFPKSKYVPNALLAVGEHAFTEAAADPSKWQDAQLAYERVIAHPLADHPVAGFARYKLGFVFWNLGDSAKATDQMAKLIELGQQQAQRQSLQNLVKSARRDIVPLYALVGNPAEAYAFFRRLSGAPTPSDELTLAMMRALGRHLTDVARYPDAAVVYGDLQRRDPGGRSCEYQAGATFATMARGLSKPDTAAALRQQLATLRTFRQGKHPAKLERQCARKTGSYLTEAAMSWHIEAIGSGGARGTGSAEAMELAVDLYGLIIDNFTAAQVAKFEVNVRGEGPPSLPTIRYARADLLYFLARWDECGPAFDHIAADEANPNASEAAFTAVLCYVNANSKGSAMAPTVLRPTVMRPELADEKISPQQRRMFAALERYICEIAPPLADADALDRWAETKYARGRAYFDAGRFEQAAAALREVAFGRSNADASANAAKLYVESLSARASKVPRPQPLCFDDLERDIPLLLELHCTPAKMSDNDELCAQLTRVRDELTQRATPP